MYEEKTSKLFTKYAIPQMIGLLLNSVYLIVDGIFIGNRLGREAMAAAAVSVPLVEIFIAISMAISVGAGILISNYLGSNDKKKANEIFNFSLIIMLVVSIVIALFGNLFINQLAVLLGSTKDIHNDVIIYMRYIITFSPALLFSFAFSSYARNDNKPNLAMVSLVVGSVSNIVLDYVFMYPLNMGIGGAALATALGPIFSVMILLPHFLFKKGDLTFKMPTFSKKVMTSIFVLGLPAFITEFSIGIVTLLYNISIIKNGFGEIGLAAYLTIGYLALIILTIFLGISQGIQPIISYFYGKKDFSRIKELSSYVLKVLGILGLVSFIGVALFSKSFFYIFTPEDADLIKFTHEKSILYFSGFVFAGVTIFIITFLQSIKKPGIALIISSLRSIILVLIFLTVLPIIFGANSIWIALTISELLTFIYAIWIYRETNKKYLVN